MEETIASGGMVTAKQPPAALAGLRILQAGGNAVDAAVATAFANGVVLPLATGIGGGGYLLFHDAAAGTTYVVDYAIQAPAAAREDMYALHPEGGFGTSSGWRRVAGDANWRGWRSIGIPGQVAGLALALARFGTISLAAALAPAIDLAEEGIPFSPEMVRETARDWPLIEQYPSTYSTFAGSGRPYRLGERFRQPRLAATLRRIAEAGAGDFYGGQIARDVAADMREHGGLIDEADLAAYEPRLSSAPLSARYRDVTIHAPPGASGAFSVVQLLKLLEGFDLRGAGHATPEALHLWIEASRLAFADRYAYLADDRLVDVPWRGLLDPGYLASRRAQIRPGRAGAHAAGDAWAWEGHRPARPYAPSRPWEPAGTAHLNVVDRQRNVVAVTDTVVAWSGVVLPRTGFVGNNGMGWFDPEPGRANSIAPGKRGLNNMAPLLLLRDGAPFAAAGARGGRKIIATVAQVVSNLVDFQMGPQAALDAPRFDASEPTATLDVRLPAGVHERVAAMGHRVAAVDGRPGAGPAAITIDADRRRLTGGEDRFGDGIAAGYDA
jgi:gamma-glutamyltranspeptidase/glutathione hydrolase